MMHVEGAVAADESLSPLLCHVLEDAKRALALRESSEDGGEPADLPGIVGEVASRLGVRLTSLERDEILAQLENDKSIFGILQPLIEDPRVSDIVVSGFAKISVQQGRRSIRTPLRFADQRSYEAFVERLLHRAGTTYSTKQPIADGMIGSLVRIHVVHRDLCDDGPYLTLRINRFTSVDTRDVERAGLAPPSIIDYLRAIVGIGRTILIVGEVGTGKTTLARALAGTIPTDESVLVIEDTPEIRIDHPHVRYMTTREDNVEGAGRVSPAQCIRAGMRMAMNRIIFGEIRDAEAAEAFVDVCASGHSGLSTIHGRSSHDAMTRLELFLSRAQKNADRNLLGAQVATAVQVLVVVDLCRHTKIRRIVDVRELGPVADGVLRQREIFSYRFDRGHPEWVVGTRVSAFREKLEQAPYSYRLHTLPERIELPTEISYREAALLMQR